MGRGRARRLLGLQGTPCGAQGGATAKYGAELVEQMQKAEVAAAQGDIDSAAAAFRRAEELAESDVETALEMASQRAKLLLQAKRFHESAEVFHSVAARETRPEKAADAHLLSAYALGRFHDETPSVERREEYVERLEEHRSRYPSSSTSRSRAPWQAL